VWAPYSLIELVCPKAQITSQYKHCRITFFHFITHMEIRNKTSNDKRTMVRIRLLVFQFAAWECLVRDSQQTDEHLINHTMSKVHAHVFSKHETTCLRTKKHAIRPCRNIRGAFGGYFIISLVKKLASSKRLNSSSQDEVRM